MAGGYEEVGGVATLESIRYRRFRALRDTELVVGPFTLLIGRNGSGKTTAMKALMLAGKQESAPYEEVVSAGEAGEPVLLDCHWTVGPHPLTMRAEWRPGQSGMSRRLLEGAGEFTTEVNPAHHLARPVLDAHRRARYYSFQPQAMVQPAELRPEVELGADGANLAAVLDRLRDESPEGFEALNEELRTWLPEYDRVLFETFARGRRALVLRTRLGGHKIPARHLPGGVVAALGFLAVLHDPDPPSLVLFDEPDRGLHPRLLRDVQQSVLRACYPRHFGEERDPIQVIASTHSPFFLDLFRERPEEVVVCRKEGGAVNFVPAKKIPEIDEILAGFRWGGLWFSGILGPGDVEIQGLTS